jgi:hypothetical protein
MGAEPSALGHAKRPIPLWLGSPTYGRPGSVVAGASRACSVNFPLPRIRNRTLPSRPPSIGRLSAHPRRSGRGPRLLIPDVYQLQRVMAGYD